MTAIESILYMIWRGIAIGVLISAPMGPVGILCIQRTLDRGRKAGFYTGIGAAISDLFYCLLTGFGLSFIEDFLNQNQHVIQLIGSVVLIAFSIYLFRKNPSSGMRRPLPQEVSAKKNILGGFLFTFSNPLIIFLIIGLFARFNFTIPEIKGYYYAVGYVFIVAGALGWWYGITYAIDKVRNRFNLRSMKILNIIIGIVILGFAAVGIVTGIIDLASPAKAAAHSAPTFSTSSERIANNSDSILFRPLARSDSPIREGKLDFKLMNHSSSPTKNYGFTDSRGNRRTAKRPEWHLLVNGTDGSLKISVRPIEYSPNTLDSQTALEFAVTPEADFLYPEFSDTLPARYLAASGMDFASGANHFRLSWDSTSLNLRAGNHKLQTIFDIPDYIGEILGIELQLSPGADLSLCQPSLTIADYPGRIPPCMDITEVEQRLRASSDPLEREWQILDINLNDKYLAEGGDYRVAIVKAPDSSYELIYLSGARLNADSWERGMLKGRLRQSGLPGIYDLEWIDPMGGVMTRHLKARLNAPDELFLQFPYHDSTLTLRAIP